MRTVRFFVNKKTCFGHLRPCDCTFGLFDAKRGETIRKRIILLYLEVNYHALFENCLKITIIVYYRHSCDSSNTPDDSSLSIRGWGATAQRRE